MLTFEHAALPFDLARGAALRLLTRSPTVTRVLGRRDTRIAALGALQIALLLTVTVRWPVAMYFIGPVVLGVVHLAADVRYLALRMTPPRVLLGASAALAVGLTVVRLCVGLGVASAARGAEVDIAVGAAWIGLALVLRLQDSPRWLLLVAPLFMVFVAWMFTHAEVVDLGLTHLHNVAAFVLWFTLFRRRGRTGWAALPLVLVVAASALLLSGACVPWTAHHGGLVAFGQRAARLGAGLWPGVSTQVGVAIALTFVFLQSVHYAVWTGWIAQDCLPGEGTPTFRMTLRSLERDFGRVGLAVIVALTLGFAIAAIGHLRQSVGWYMTLARAHVWFELAVFAYFVPVPAVVSAAFRKPRVSTAGGVAAAAVALSACGSPCQDVETVSETSHGSFTYVGTSGSPGGASMTHGALRSDVLSLEGEGPGSAILTGSFDDSVGYSHTFILHLSGLVSGGTTTLGAGSVACFDEAEPIPAPDGGVSEGYATSPCPALEGTVTTTAFATDCESSTGCTLLIIGSMTAEASLPDATFSVNLDLEHEDLRKNIACPVTSSPWTEGTPGS